MVINELKALRGEIASVHTNIAGIEAQLDENTQIVKAIRHNNTKLEGTELDYR